MPEYQMVGDNFRLGYRVQRYWDNSMAGAFFCGELGAGLFLFAMIYENVPGLILGLLLTGIGKPGFHLTHMGVPGKSWRAILRPDRSWTSRGLIAIVVFVGAGLLHTINLLFGGAIPFDGVIRVVAGAAALVVMTYQGFAMSHSTAIALWSTAMMPILSLLYALTGGAFGMLVLEAGSLTAESGVRLVYTAAGFLLADLFVLFAMLHAAYHGSTGSRLSAELLFRRRYAGWFHGVVVVLGILIPLYSMWAGQDMLARLAAASAMLAGFYAFRVLIFKAGVYEPVMNFSNIVGAGN